MPKCRAQKMPGTRPGFRFLGSGGRMAFAPSGLSWSGRLNSDAMHRGASDRRNANSELTSLRSDTIPAELGSLRIAPSTSTIYNNSHHATKSAIATLNSLRRLSSLKSAIATATPPLTGQMKGKTRNTVERTMVVKYR